MPDHDLPDGHKLPGEQDFEGADDLKEKLRAAFGHGSDAGIEEDPIEREPRGIDLPDTSDIDSRLKVMVSKTEGYKERQTQTADQIAKSRQNEQADARGLGMGLQIAYTIIGFPLLGFGVGAAIDAATRATIWKGFIGLGGCVLGVFVAMILINRANAET